VRGLTVSKRLFPPVGFGDGLIMQRGKGGRRGLWLILLALLGLVVAAYAFGGRSRQPTTKNVDLSTLIRRVHTKPGTIQRVVFHPSNQRIQATLDSGLQLDANYPTSQAEIQFQQLLQKQGVDFASTPPSSGSSWVALAASWLVPLLLIGALWWFLMRRMRGQGGGAGGGLLGFGKSRAKRISPSMPKTSYRDVAGADEAVSELKEIKEFLASPRRFRALGAQIPKGVLLHGPPGTGKTLLARATAGEAGVPFFSISGSDFVEMFVGVGASRVRDLFEQAKREAPAIVFIDELDAVGRHRGAGLGGGHDEREHTLNQLLVAMDGFDQRTDIIVIAATNRPDVLDPALLRPGRFDRQIPVDPPDRRARRQILEVHARGKPLSAHVDLDRLAAATPGFTGADLANLLNEAALLAGRRGLDTVGQEELEEATLRVVAGPEKRTRVLSGSERRVSAYHEAGHAVVGELLEHADKPQKISIIGRARALGFTLSLPEEDRLLAVRKELMDGLAMSLGGRTAEELIFGDISTGAMNDLEKVTDTATAMVTRYGMSDLVGPLVVAPPEQQPFLGRQLAAGDGHSEELQRRIDREVRRIVEEAHTSARRVLDAHTGALDRVAQALMEHETLDREEFERVMAGDTELPVARDGGPPKGTVAQREPEPTRPAPAPEG
jgi:cell division protease FtsH